MRFLTVLLLLVSSALGQSESQPRFTNYGWYPAPEEVTKVADKLKFYSDQIQALPVRDDTSALNYAFLCQLLDVKILPTLDQGPVGACVGFATARAADITAAADICHRREAEEWRALFSPEALYAIGRQQAGRLGTWDGSTGAWSVDGLQKLGTLHQLTYDETDLTAYSPARAKAWAAQGVPSGLLPTAKEHPFLSAGLVTTTEQAKAALQNGYPLITCSMISYPSVRDSDGFLKANGRRWAHAMCVAAYRSASTGREGFLIINSWRCSSHSNGWVTGPIWPTEDADFPQPIGSFWVSPADLQLHLSYNDTWAISGYQGFAKRELEWPEVFSQAGGTTRE